MDYPRLESFALNPEVRLQDLEGFALGSPEVLAYCREHYLDNRGTKFSEITDGQVFDLGGVSLEAVALPGHSDGHFTFFNRDEGYVFTGDGINADVHLKKLDREGLLVYEVPAGYEDFSISTQDTYSDGTTGDTYFVYFTPEKQ